MEHTRSLIAESLRAFLRATLTETNWHSLEQRPGEGPASLPLGKEGENANPDPWSSPLGGSQTPAATKPALPPMLDPMVQPTLHAIPARKPVPRSRSYSLSHPETRPSLQEQRPAHGSQGQSRQPSPDAEAKRLFKPLEAYITGVFTSFQCLNSSFLSHRPHFSTKPAEPARRPFQPEARKDDLNDSYPISELDPKLLLLGSVAENGSWWTGGQEERRPMRTASHRSNEATPTSAGMRSPHIEWAELDDWYMLVLEAARSWPRIYDELVNGDVSLAVTDAKLCEIEAQILAGQEHVQRTLLKAAETMLKRPGRPLSDPHDLRFLLIIAANPFLRSSDNFFAGQFAHPELAHARNRDSRGDGPSSGKHSGIIKRILGLMAHASTDCQNHLQTWFSRYPTFRFVQFKDLVGGFLNYRLLRQNEKKYEAKVDITAGLIPMIPSGRSPASLHAALGHSSAPARAAGTNKKQKDEPKKTIYQEDWQIKAAARVLSLLFEANNSGASRRSSVAHQENLGGGGSRDRVQTRGQLLATSDFYNTLLDDSDLVADFEAWEGTREHARDTTRDYTPRKFSFCQYPFLLSIWAKIQILEHDARRQMQNMARDAFFNSIMTNRSINQYLIMTVRRDCLVEDSLKTVSEVIGSGGEDIKKGLRVVFTGEEGVDAGGLRKEWFLLLIREVFNPDHGKYYYLPASPLILIPPSPSSFFRFYLSGTGG